MFILATRAIGGMFGVRVYAARQIMSRRARTVAKNQYIPMPCGMYRGVYTRHNPRGVYCPKCGKQTPFIPSEGLKNIIKGLLIDLCSLSRAPDYAA